MQLTLNEEGDKNLHQILFQYGEFWIPNPEDLKLIAFAKELRSKMEQAKPSLRGD